MSFPHTHKVMALALLACGLLASSPASARLDIGINLGAPVYAEPTYVAPPPVYAAPTYAAPVVAYPGYYHDRHYFHGRRDFHHRR